MVDGKPKVVIVGNGGSHIGSGNGKIIDSFDKVVRLNKYLIEGHEEDVGSKTDAVVVNTKTYLHHFYEEDLIERLESLQEVVVLTTSRDFLKNPHPTTNQYLTQTLPKALELISGYENMDVMDESILDVLDDMIGVEVPCTCCERSKALFVTTGLYTIGNYLKQGYDVSIIGFDSMDLKMKIDEHGWDVPVDKLLHYQGHGILNGELDHRIFQEAKWLRGMVGLGIITRLDG